jgi:hypothetical protein
LETVNFTTNGKINNPEVHSKLVRHLFQIRPNRAKAQNELKALSVTHVINSTNKVVREVLNFKYCSEKSERRQETRQLVIN